MGDRLLLQIARADALLGAAKQECEDLRRVYDTATPVPLWLDAAGRPTRAADEALAMLAHAADEGLWPSDYGVTEWQVRATALAAAAPAQPADAARFDAGLTLGMLRYLRHLHNGRIDPRALGLRLETPDDAHDFAAMLRAAVAVDRLGDTADGLRPPLVQYRLLRGVLPAYRALAASPRATPPPLPPRTVHPGDPYAGVSDLHALLGALGDLAADAPPPDGDAYAGPLVEAVERFQARHGLDPDGVLGPATMAALRVSMPARVRQIEAAMERLRWLPHLGERRLLALNIPMFQLWGWNAVPAEGMPELDMKAIVGRALRSQTPVFAKEMRQVIFRPYWNVPPSIARRELLPLIERNPAYLQREQMEIVAGAGDDASPVPPTAANLARLKTGALRLRQRPGPQNALGLVKFVFPNDENVYMHGTPARELFGRARRDFSHGCVRVEDPVRLAEWVLKDRPEWTRARILEAMNGAGPVRVDLAEPIQVVLFYTTAVVFPDSGLVHFSDDIYGHDARLEAALAGIRRSRAAGPPATPR